MSATCWRKKEASLSVISIRETIKVRQHIACFHRLGVKTGILVILLVLQSPAVSERQEQLLVPHHLKNVLLVSGLGGNT